MEVKLETPLGLRRSPRRRGSDSDLETTVGTAPGDLTSCSLDDTVEITAASANSSTNSSVTFSPFKPKLMRCTSTPAMGVSMNLVGRLPVKPMPMSILSPHQEAVSPSPNAHQISPQSGSLSSQSCREGSDGRDSCADTSDSGLGSTDISMASFRSKGAIPKKTAHHTNNARITRSRASTSTSSSGMDSDFASPIPPPLTIGKAGGRSSKKKQQNTTMSNNTRDISRWTHAPPESPVPTSVNHKFTVYSPGLFVDRDHLDIVRRLADKNLDHVLDKVWACLPVIDLCRAMQVSSRWNQSVNASSGALARWREAKLQLSPENPKKKEAAQERLLQRTLRRSPRKALGNVSNLLAADDSGAVFEASLHQPLETSRTTRLRSGGSSSIISQQPTLLVSPSKFRHRVFSDEASRLGPKEQLRPCPRCTLPSRIDPSQNRGQCTRAACQFDFCTRCLCNYHGNDSRCPVRNSIKVASRSSTSKEGHRRNLDFSEASVLGEESLVNVTASKDEVASKPATKNVSLNCSRPRRKQVAASVASEKSRSRLKRL